MDEEVRRLVILFVFQCAMLVMLEGASTNYTPFQEWRRQQLCFVTLALHGYRRLLASRPRRLWAHERGLHRPGFFDQNLLGSFNAREFKGRMRMDVSTFEYLCSTLAPYMLRQDTNMNIAISISRLATSNSMQSIVDLYKIGLSTSQLAVSQFTRAVKSTLLKTYIRWPTAAVMEKFADEFQDIHGIPYVVGAVDGSHIPIVAPHLHAADYYNRKGFHSVLLQGVVSSKCLFWDFDIGWAVSMHDANIWARTKIGKFCEVGRLSPYALVGDAAYPCRPWMLAPFKGHRDGLTREEYNWNYVQSSTRMCVERTFGMLKGRWRILLKRIDVHLKNVPDLVSTCLVLHNICIILGDSFWKAEWMQEATEEVHNSISSGNQVGRSNQERLAVANHALTSLAGIEEDYRETLEYFKQESAKQFQIAMGTGGKTSKELAARRNGIAKSLWMAKTKACIAETFPIHDES